MAFVLETSEVTRIWPGKSATFPLALRENTSTRRRSSKPLHPQSPFRMHQVHFACPRKCIPKSLSRAGSSPKSLSHAPGPLRVPPKVHPKVTFACWLIPKSPFRTHQVHFACPRKCIPKSLSRAGSSPKSLSHAPGPLRVPPKCSESASQSHFRMPAHSQSHFPGPKVDFRSPKVDAQGIKVH